MQVTPADQAYATTHIASTRAFNNPHAMQPVLDLLVTCRDEDLRAVLIHGLVEHTMRGSQYAPAGDERRDAIADFGTVVASLEPYDNDGDRCAWLIGVLVRAWIAPRDEAEVAAWRLFSGGERRALWVIIHDAVRHIRTLRHTSVRDQALYAMVDQIADVIARMAVTTQAADARDSVAMSEGILSRREAQLHILPILRDCDDTLHEGAVDSHELALNVCEQALRYAVVSLVDSELLPPHALNPFRDPAYRALAPLVLVDDAL